MARIPHLLVASLILVACTTLEAAAQTTEWQPDAGTPALGDLARSLRKKKEPDPAPQTVIDNDNLSKVMQDAESQRQTGTPIFSIDSTKNKFQMSSPDGSCSLSFNAEAVSLVSTPYVAQDLPESELAKLDGPAAIRGKTLQIEIYNGSSWSIKEITVGLTIIRHDPPTTAVRFGTAKLIAASEGEDTQNAAEPSEKRPDSTALYHLKGWATPQATAEFEENMEAPLDAGQEWHWAIVQARGTPPTAHDLPASMNAPPITPALTAPPTAGHP